MNTQQKETGKSDGWKERKKKKREIQTQDKTKTQNGVRFFMLLHAFQTRDRSNIITRNTFTGTDVMGEMASWKKKTR